MKPLTLKVIATLYIIASSFMLTTPFLQKANAHDTSSDCTNWQEICSIAYNQVMYYCYGDGHHPDMCDAAWGWMGYSCHMSDLICNHDPNEEH